SENFESTAVGFKQSLTGNAFGREWGKLPNDIAKNPDVRDLALVLLAFRTTFAGKWILKWRKVQKACSKGLGERAFWAALAILIRLGLITRVKIPIPGKQGRGKVIDDPLTLPTFGENYRRVERAWFDGTMTMKALALLFFIRAWGLVGVHPW